MSLQPKRPAASPDDEVPHTIEVPKAEIAILIGLGGSTIKRLIQATGCRIEVPRQEAQNSGDGAEVEVQLVGATEQRRKAAKAIRDILAGGDFEDSAATAEGAMVLPHNLDNFDKEFWLSWRLVPTEAAHKVRAEVSRANVRLVGERTLVGRAAESVRSEARDAILEAQELVEIVVNASLEFDTDNAKYDPACSPLVDAHGLLLHRQQPEDGVVPIRIVGPEEAARDAAALLEARFIKGKSTASVLQLPGQIQTMTDQMAGDFDKDLQALEEEFRVKVHRSQALLWIVGISNDSVAQARHTIREMLQFYYPERFHLLHGIKKALVEKLRADPELRVITARPDCAASFDAVEGTAWICGDCMSMMQQRMDAVKGQWDAEHWELELSDYGAAMWLLGPRGTGEYLARIQGESGAQVKVCPNARRVWAEGPPDKVKRAEKLVLEAMQRLERKKQAEADAPLKPKELLSDVPEHMRAILEKLAELDERKRLADNKQRIVDRERAWGLERAAAENVEAAEAEAAQGNRDRSRSPSQPRSG